MGSDATLRFQSHLLRLGASAMVLSIVPALLGGFDLTASAEYAIATHVAMLMIGVLLLCVGLSWNSLKLTAGREHFAFWCIVFGGFIVFVTGTLAALKGVGGETLSAFDPDATGSAGAELLVWFLLVLAGVLLLIGLVPIGVRVWSGLEGERSPAKKSLPERFAEGLNLDPREESAGPVLFRWGFTLMWLGVASASLLHGLLGRRLLGVVPHATIGITALILMSMGLVWRCVTTNLVRRARRARVRFAEARRAGVAGKERDQIKGAKDREEWKLKWTPRVVRWGLLSGLLLNVGAGWLASRNGLHTDPLAAVSAGFLAVGGYAKQVKLVALLALLANSIGIIAFAHGIYDRGPEDPPATSMDERQADRLRRFGTLALVIGFLTAWLPELSRVPRLGVGTYATLLIIGPMFLCFSRIWQMEAQRQKEAEKQRLVEAERRRLEKAGGERIAARVNADAQRQVRLTYRQQKFAVSAMSLGALGIVVAGMVLALVGVGGDTLAISAAGAVGSERAELLAKIFIYAAILTLGVGMILFWHGIRPPSRTLVHRIVWGLGMGLIAFVLQAAFYHSVVNRRLAGSYPIRLPDYSYGVTDSLVDTIAWDDSTQLTAQNWSREDWQWFSHASQGGAFEVPIPYDWILSLEQPTVALLPNLGVGLLMDQAYLEQFGFIPNPVRWYEPDSLSVRQGYVARYLGRLDPPSAPPVLGLVENNPDRLPVGFARTDDWIDHSTGQMIDVLGFTCAACHTSQIDYYDEAGDRLVRIPIRGGPANVDLGKFRRAVSVSLYLTQLLPGRFDRFAERLEVARGADRRALKEDFDALIDRLREVRVLQRELEIYPTEEGFGRLDAMGRIFNFVFGTDLGDESNLAVADAPVNFPPLWDASRFDWVQYNASFRQPMIRNAGQSMGVFASVDLHGAGEAVAVEDDPVLFASSIDLLNIHDMELLLGGCTLNATNRPELLGEGCRRDFEGLRSPTWPSLFPKIDRELAATGAALYQQHCAVCHLPSPGDSARFSAQAWADPDLAGNSFLALRGSTLQEVRTDPRAAINFAIRSVDLGVLGRRLGIDIDSVSEAAELSPLVDSVLTRSYELLGRELDRRPKGVAAAEALQITVNSVLARRYDDYGIEPALQDILEGHRGPKTRVFLGYRARPLNGVWATAPFLHNGSVPTLYHLLSPQAERPDTFHLGSRLFDPELVGFDFERHDPGFFEFDASLPGNSNYGHSFEGDPQDWRGRPGVLGPELSHQDRMAIIEFLKKLPPLPVRPHDEGG